LDEDVRVALAAQPSGAIAEFELSDYMKANVATNKYSYSRHARFVLPLPNAPTGKIVEREITLAGAATGGL
jgi:acyl-coenzyme A synthetase/AMP-(fatty) acid ligase